MPQFYPDGPAAVNLNAIQDNGGINLPPESPAEFDTPGLQGSMQQLLSENLGKFVMADFLVGVSSIVRRVGVLYSVGRGFLVIYSEDYHTFQVCDIFSLKFISFFPPGFEPSIEELLSGKFTSGILSPGVNTGILAPEGTGQTGSSSMNNFSGMNNSSAGGMNNARPSSGNGCRTLGQR